MKLRTLAINDFRGFAGEYHFDLNAEAVVLVAANGQGKTSFFDAILWGLTGLLPRLGESPKVRSLYSQGGEARVELELGADDDSQCLRIVRREPGGLSVEWHGKRSEGLSATSTLHTALWPEAEQAPDGPMALAGALTRSVYLQQDLVRDFVEGDDDKARFTAVSELAGAGRVTELARELESARLGWSRATNVKDRELSEAFQRLDTHQAQLDSLGSVDGASAELVAERWAAWWPTAEKLVPAIGEREQPTPSGAEAANVLEAALRLLEAARRKAERRLVSAESLLAEIKGRPAAKETFDLPTLRKALSEAESQLAVSREALGVAEQAAAEQRRKQVERRQAVEELGALAELAIRHIDGSCPVCEQEHDHSHTRANLEQLMAAAGSSPEEAPEAQTTELAEAVQGREAGLSSAQAALREAESAERELFAWKSERNERLNELGISTAEEESVEALTALISTSREAKEAIDACEAEGERLSVDLVGASEQARARELRTTIDTERREVKELGEIVAARKKTGDLTSQILEALREASASVVETELRRLDPLLQLIYSMADPHPCFRVVRLLSKVARGRGHLSAALDDQLATLSVEQPEEILSSSQLNALAVSVFLALNLGLPSVPLPIAMLDDPLQSLDDVNLLGLVDLLRRAKGQRQLLLSTHDRRFGALLARKLRPVGEDRPTRIIEIDGWGRGGPIIRESEAHRDSQPLRIAA
jgi:DNA repair exonuclease SbcCD ATPase subunit